MEFTKLTLLADGATVWVNLAQVIAVTPDGSGSALLTTTGGTIQVREAPIKIVQRNGMYP